METIYFISFISVGKWTEPGRSLCRCSTWSRPIQSFRYHYSYSITFSFVSITWTYITSAFGYYFLKKCVVNKGRVWCTTFQNMLINILFVALVNKGNVLFQKGDYEKAREFYREALNNDSSCVEALYNHGRSGSWCLKKYCHYLTSIQKVAYYTTKLCNEAILSIYELELYQCTEMAKELTKALVPEVIHVICQSQKIHHKS